MATLMSLSRVGRPAIAALSGRVPPDCRAHAAAARRPTPRAAAVQLPQKPALSARQSRPLSVAVQASGTSYELAPHGVHDWSPLLGVVGLIAYWSNRVSLNAPQLLKVVAWYQIFIAGVALLTRKAELDRVASVIAPAILATYTLGLTHVSYMDAAIGLFGFHLAEGVEGPFWPYIATLAAAIYAGYPSQWYVAAWGVLAAVRLIRGSQNNRVPLAHIPVLGAVVFAFYKQVTPAFTLALMIGQVFASGIAYAESVADSS